MSRGCFFLNGGFISGMWVDIIPSRMAYADPWVLERLRGGDSLGGVDGQHRVDEVLRFRRYSVPLRRWVLQRNSANHRHFS